MLRKIRTTLALFFFAALTLLFLDFTGFTHDYLGWTAKIQLVPAILAANLVVFLGLVLLTLLFGRIYCSVICPLGIFQDIVSRLSGAKNRFAYRQPRKALVILRYTLLALFALPLFFGMAGGLVNLLDPYSTFGRMISQIFGPAYKYANNALAYFAERFNSYAFHHTDIWLKGEGVLVIAIVSFAVVSIFAWKSGRGYCNSICPVGAFLGLLAKEVSLFKPRFDSSKCRLCGLCTKNCKASCIDILMGKIDYSRCVACFNCVGICPKNAITYAMPLKKENKEKEENKEENLSESGISRRNVLSGSAMALLGMAAELQAHRPADGGLAVLADKIAPRRAKPITAPGSGSFKNFHDRCTGCQLCASVCPNQVLRPGKTTKPVMSYERGYCRPECVKCSQVCPTGAIRPITVAEKSSIQIGCAVWEPDTCIVNADKVNCGNCARHCPTHAISMIPQSASNAESLKIPMIDTERCIGCGACEQLCPARPHSAIYVEGIEVHKGV